ncbi:MAG TPA: hypothetical protein DCQ98_21685 [Planctomycetaceae bacterium]|nr:hypothetical protein [Planctomycetaceae bacterium]HRE99909.1 2-oxo acid dehydrogenase subunit E2 [Pirellulaceae bacterium]
MAEPIVIPRLGWSMEQGTFAGWLKKPGSSVRPGDALFQLEGDKALQDVEAIDDGILHPAPDAPEVGAVVPVGAVIGALAEPGETIDWQGLRAAAAASLAKQSEATPSAPPPAKYPEVSISFGLTSPAPAPNVASSPAATSAVPATGGNENEPSPAGAAGPAARRLARSLKVDLQERRGSGPRGRVTTADVSRFASTPEPPSPSRVRATPRARRAAKLAGIDLANLAGTGAGGRIRERDVLTARDSTGPSTRGTGGSIRLPISTRRLTIAERMVESRNRTVPVTLTTRADATGLVDLRRQFRALSEREVPSYQDLIIRLTADALAADPIVAGRWDDDAIVLPSEDDWHIGFAVDTDQGLLVPVLRDVRRTSIAQLARRSRELVERARSGRLTAAEMQGSVLTVTNLGAFGIDAFTPVIRWPEAAILGLGAIRREPCVMDDHDRIEIRSLMTLSLTFDHRVLDGGPAARFLQRLVASIENPSAALLGA